MLSIVSQRPLVCWKVILFCCASTGIGSRYVCGAYFQIIKRSCTSVTPILSPTPLRKRDVAANIWQRGEENHQVRAGRLHIVPPSL